MLEDWLPPTHMLTYPKLPKLWSNIVFILNVRLKIADTNYIKLPPSTRISLTRLTLGLQSWIDEMSKYLKKADPNHMITVGEEGFYTKGSSGESVNPGTGWASLTGQDFIANHASKAIDFAAAHIWPDNWEVSIYACISLCVSNQGGQVCKMLSA